MFHFAYNCVYHYGVLSLRETAPDNGCETQPRLNDWSDEQLAQIRLVLQRLTALRIQNSEDVEDLVQETMLTMALKCPRGELKKGLLVWSMGILRRKIGNYYRKAHRYASLNEQDASCASAVRQTSATQSPEARVQYRELRLLINKILAGLTQPERQAISMLLAGMAPSHIVQRLDPERYQNVINWLYRGRHKLQRELVKYGYGPDG